MSVAAQKWAWEQPIPNMAAKFLLIALADQTDDHDGSVCYRQTTAEFFSEKCAMSVATFWRTITALELNGYVQRASGSGSHEGSDFWLSIARPARDAGEWNKILRSDKRPKDESSCLPGRQDPVSQGERILSPRETPPVSQGESTCLPGRQDTLCTTKETQKDSARGRARATEAAHARASGKGIAATPALPARCPLTARPDDPARQRFVGKTTRQWHTFQAWVERHGEKMPKFIYEAEEMPGHEGRHFDWDHVQDGLDWWGREHPGEDPPGWVEPKSKQKHQQTESPDDDEHRQSATGL